MRGNRFGGFATYTEYLESPRWKRMRSHFCGPMCRCYACDTPSRLQIHHTSYDHLGNEQANDFIVVCRDCHEKIHVELRNRFPTKSLQFQVERTDHVFSSLFARTLREARAKYRHHDRCGDFALGGRQPSTKAKLRPLPKPVPQNDPMPNAVLIRTKTKTRRKYGPGKGKGFWRQAKEAKRFEALIARDQRETDQRVAEDMEHRSKLGAEYSILKLPTLEQRIRARIALRQQQVNT